MPRTVTVLPDDSDSLRRRLEGGSVRVDVISVRSDYSGRGMFGATCLGIVVARQDVSALLVALTSAYSLPTSAGDVSWVGSAQVDGMGLDRVVYWPDVGLMDSSNSPGVRADGGNGVRP